MTTNGQTPNEGINLVLSDGKVIKVKRPVRRSDVNPMTTSLVPSGEGNNSEAVSLTSTGEVPKKRQTKGGHAKQGRRQYNKKRAERRSYTRTVTQQQTATDQAGMPVVDGAVTLSFERQRDLTPAAQFDPFEYSRNQRNGKGTT